MDTRKQDFLTMVKICKRAEEMNISAGDRFTLMMDLEHVHKTVGLRLDDLLLAKDYDFMHDVVGIQRHLNRVTGELEDCFLPRYAKQDVSAALEDAVVRSRESEKTGVSKTESIKEI